ncbi:MAG: NfeD family protein [Candidatus Micrarchaeota archaeon]|nr:NfeD family protein [Candidatus Micrarchaeota archaeon]
MIAYIIILLGIAIIIWDIFTAGIFYPIGVGLIIAGLVYLVYPSDLLAISTGLVGTILTYYFTFKLVRSNYEKLTLTTEEIIGLKNKVGRVIKVLKNGYLVEIDGQEWTARSEYPLKEGDKVIVVEEGVVLKVKPLK